MTADNQHQIASRQPTQPTDDRKQDAFNRDDRGDLPSSQSNRSQHREFASAFGDAHAECREDDEDRRQRRHPGRSPSLGALARYRSTRLHPRSNGLEVDQLHRGPSAGQAFFPSFAKLLDGDRVANRNLQHLRFRNVAVDPLRQFGTDINRVGRDAL